MPTARNSILLGMVFLSSVNAQAQQPAPTVNVAALQAKHDRALIKDLTDYVKANPKAEDIDQAYMSMFDKIIEHDWFADHENLAKQYLSDRPEGPVHSLAQIVGTMARAQSNDYAQALSRYSDLMKGLGKTEQEEFASNFADSLASAATGAGEYAVAKRVYQILLEPTATARPSARKFATTSTGSTTTSSPRIGCTTNICTAAEWSVDWRWCVTRATTRSRSARGMPSGRVARTSSSATTPRSMSAQ